MWEVGSDSSNSSDSSYQKTFSQFFFHQIICSPKNLKQKKFTKKNQNVTKPKTQIYKIEKLKCDKTQKLKMWQNSKTWNVTKLKNSKCDKTQKLKMWQNSQTQNETKLTKLTNLKCDNKIKMWQNSKYDNSKTQNVKKTTPKTQIVTKLKNSNSDETQKLKFYQYSISKLKKVFW